MVGPKNLHIDAFIGARKKWAGRNLMMARMIATDQSRVAAGTGNDLSKMRTKPLTSKNVPGSAFTAGKHLKTNFGKTISTGAPRKTGRDFYRQEKTKGLFHL